MKQWLKISFWVLGVSLILWLLHIANTYYEDNKLPDPVVKIKVDGPNAFLSKDELLKQLHRKHLIYEDQTWAELNTSAIENFIRINTHVKKVHVYRSIGRSWTIDITLRKPIVRVFNKHGESYYVDSEGYLMKIAPSHAARVLVASGEINEKLGGLNVPQIINNDSLISIHKLDDIYRISNYVCNDPLFQSLVGQIYVEKNGDLILIPLIGDQRIVIGSADTEEDVKQKFEKLRVFYEEAMPYTGWETYKEIVLKYDGQIVCKKKE